MTGGSSKQRVEPGMHSYLSPSGAKIDVYRFLLIDTDKSILSVSWDMEAPMGEKLTLMKKWSKLLILKFAFEVGLIAHYVA